MLGSTTTVQFAPGTGWTGSLAAGPVRTVVWADRPEMVARVVVGAVGDGVVDEPEGVVRWR
jgi:hypothetical protein